MTFVNRAIVMAIVLLLTAGVHGAAGSPGWTGVVITANEADRSISLVDSATRIVHTVKLPIAPHNVQTSADGRYLYATGMPNGAADMGGMVMDAPAGLLLGFDLQRVEAGPVMKISVGKDPAHVIADRANRFAYVTISGENAVKVVDLHRRSIVATIPVGEMPHGLRMSPDERQIYVSDMGEDAISFIDVARRKEIARVRAGSKPVQVAVAPNGKTVYATLAGENAVAVLDVASHKVLARVPVGSNPAQLYMSPEGSRVYVADQGTKKAPGHTVSVIDAVSRKVIASVSVASGAHGIVVTPDGSRAYVTGSFGAELAEIDTRTLRVRFIDVGQGPNGVTLTPRLRQKSQ